MSTSTKDHPRPPANIKAFGYEVRKVREGVNGVDPRIEAPSVPPGPRQVGAKPLKMDRFRRGSGQG